ncbi:MULTISPECIES: polyprenyl synthetase family protein [Paenibacillus]|uniref:Polyprenyl synthetase family protein n=1 Tax=Paenibacillus alvei TaxID=44250 RepID=A0ABT4EFP9_PAEAL|nr:MULTISPECIES: farnesyl diphosphate synthase [Paenibacillus]MCY9532577.1 polyprenyl synthetase family protein [Paenibacillus alvei]
MQQRRRVIRLINYQSAGVFADYVKQQATRIESILPKMLDSKRNTPEPLTQSMHYSLMAGGKRLRPVCVLMACDSLGGNTRAAEPVACAIEMIHTYSLVHDDLPAMDNDDLRRGKPTNHKIYGEAMAILAGDGLLTQAFHCIVQSTRQHGVAAEVSLSIVEELAEYAGMNGMVGGQAADMLGEQGITTLDQLEYIHLHKTSDLIVCSLRAGGRIGGASEQQLQALTTYGYKLGLAFQIQDDILDVIGDEAMLGKPKGSDEKSGKVTYPYFIGLEESRQEVERLTEEAKAAIANAGFQKPELLVGMADYLMKRDH